MHSCLNRLMILTLTGLMVAFVFNILKQLKGGAIFNYSAI